MKEYTIFYTPARLYRITPGKKNTLFTTKSTVDGLTLDKVLEYIKGQDLEKRPFKITLNIDVPEEDQRVIRERLSRFPRFSGLNLVELTLQKYQKQ
jgi:hypothetical protein